MIQGIFEWLISVSIDNVATPIVCILSGFLQQKFGPLKVSSSKYSKFPTGMGGGSGDNPPLSPQGHCRLIYIGKPLEHKINVNSKSNVLALTPWVG
jgi:hypothetical protein